jgi:hypothetical protein
MFHVSAAPMCTNILRNLDYNAAGIDQLFRRADDRPAASGQPAYAVGQRSGLARAWLRAAFQWRSAWSIS